MSLHPEPIGTIPAETARVARAAFPKGTVVMRLRDEFGTLYGDEDFGRLYPSRGQPALTPWRLALVTVFQFLENLSASPGWSGWSSAGTPRSRPGAGRRCRSRNSAATTRGGGRRGAAARSRSPARGGGAG